MLDVAFQRPDGQTVVDLGVRTAPPLPVLPALSPVLPDGLKRGSTVTVSGSVSLVLALLGAASAGGAWCALVGLPMVSAEAAVEYGINLSRLAVLPMPGPAWTTAVGALVDAVDIVAARPGPRLAPGDVRRLMARARTRDAVLMPVLTTPSDEWPGGADLRLQAEAGEWEGIGSGHGRLRRRLVTLRAEGRGTAARPRSASLWLPTDEGGIGSVSPAATVTQVGFGRAG